MKIFCSLILTGLWLIGGSVSAAEINHRHLQAVELADAQMMKFDQGIYVFDESVAKIFKEHVPEKEWAVAMQDFRKDFGAIQSRYVVSYEYDKSISGLSDGDYITVQFKSQYEHKIDANEFVVMSLEEDQWRLLGYYMR